MIVFFVSCNLIKYLYIKQSVIDICYLQCLPIENHKFHYNILLKGVYYFYHGIKLDDNIKLICKNGNKKIYQKEI